MAGFGCSALFGLAVHAPAVVDAALLTDARRIFLKLHRLQLNLGFDELFNIGHQPLVAAGDKTHGQSRSTGTARAANAVYIVFGVERNIKVEHRRHILDVQSACSHVGADQQVNFAALERIQCFEPLVLTFVAVQRGGFEAFAFERTGQPGAAKLAVDKDKCLLDVTAFKNLVQGAALVVGAHTVEMLLDCGRGGVGTGDFNRYRVLQKAGGQALDFGRERRGKQQRDALLGQVAQDALQVGQKADVQHAVGFVKHHIFNLVQHRVLGLDVVKQTARRGDQHLDAFFQLGGLRLHVHAAKHDGAGQVGVFGVELDLFGHLNCQLTGGQQHQRPHRVARRRG